MRTKFIFTQHFRERFSERILNQPDVNFVKGVDRLIMDDIKEAKEKREYLNLPRFVLYLYEKYKGVNGVQIFESDNAIYVTKHEKGMGFNYVLTCWNKKSDYYFGPNGMFRNSALPNKEIYNRIAEMKIKCRQK